MMLPDNLYSTSCAKHTGKSSCAIMHTSGNVHRKFELIRTAHAAPFLKMNNPADDYQPTQFLDMGLGNERN